MWVPSIATATGTFQPAANADGDQSGARALKAVIEPATPETPSAVRGDEIQSADLTGLRTLVSAWQHLQAEGARGE